MAAIFGAALGFALFVTAVAEGIGFMVLLIPARIRRIRAEARRELQREWVAWNERRMAAEREGLPFDEPPPAGPDDEQVRKNGK